MASIVIRRAPKPARLRWQRRKSRAVLTPAATQTLAPSLVAGDDAFFGNVTDNFNRANGALGSNWLTSLDIAGPAPVISGNQCQGSNTNCPAYWSPSVNTFSNNQFAQATYVTAASFGHGGVVVRHDASGHSNFYLFYANGSNYSLYRCDGGVYSDIADATNGGYANGDVLRLEATGSTLVCKVNGVTWITHTDTTYSSGQPGILPQNSSELMDDWSAGPIVVSATVSATAAVLPSFVTDADSFFAPAISSQATLLPALVSDADTFYAPAFSESALLLPSLFSDTDSIYAPVALQAQSLQAQLVLDADTVLTPSLAVGPVALAPALVTDTDVVFAASFGSVWTLAPVLVVDTDTIFAPAAFQPQSLLPQLVADGDDIRSTDITYLPILRPAVFSDADRFYPASLVGGLPVQKHPLTGSVHRPSLTGNLGSRPMLTGTLKKVA